jgi:hypothetical protein
VVTVNAATSIVLPSSSTLGIPSTTARRVWITGWWDGTAFRLGVFCALGSSSGIQIYPLQENGIASSSLIGTGSTSAGTHYTAGAAVTNGVFRILGFVEWGPSGMTAGTWTTTNLAAIQTFGPGIPRPGQPIQRAAKSASGSGANVSFTPTSAANPFRALANANVSGSASTNLTCVLQRNGSAIATGVVFEGTASANQTIAAGPVYDFPNTTSSTSYTSTASAVTLQSLWVEAEELMG